MISAKEAKEISIQKKNDTYKQVVESTLEEIEKLILCEANNGRLALRLTTQEECNLLLLQDVQNKLTDLGYRISKFDNAFGCYLICWS